MLNAQDTENLLHLLERIYTGDMDLTDIPAITTEGAYYGYTYAIRRCAFEPTSCQTCKDADGETIPALLVIEGHADHENGKCTFTFVGGDE